LVIEKNKYIKRNHRDDLQKMFLLMGYINQSYTEKKSQNKDERREIRER